MLDSLQPIILISMSVMSALVVYVLGFFVFMHYITTKVESLRTRDVWLGIIWPIVCITWIACWLLDHIYKTLLYTYQITGKSLLVSVTYALLAIGVPFNKSKCFKIVKEHLRYIVY